MQDELVAAEPPTNRMDHPYDTMTYSDAQDLYTRRADQYEAFIGFFRSRAALRYLINTRVPLRSGLRVLDAGCGSGMATFALLDALGCKKLEYERIDAFDLTPAMLSRFGRRLNFGNGARVNLAQADVLELDALPTSWRNYDLIVSASMLEYLPKDELPRALCALGRRLAPSGRMLVMITRRTFETKFLVEWLWHANRYTHPELRAACQAADLEIQHFLRFPLRYEWLNRANYVFLARASG